MRHSARPAIRLALIYALLGGLWVFFSDLSLQWLVSDPAQLMGWQTWKGWFFVAVTAILVFFLVWRQLYREHQLNTELLAGRERLAAVFEGSRDAILLLRTPDQVLLANSRARPLLGLGDEPGAQRAPEWLANQLASIEADVQLEGSWTGEVWVPAAGELERPYLATVSRVDRWPPGLSGPGSIWVLTDISDLRRTQKELEQLSWYDPLTRLPNQRLILRHLAQAMTSRRTGDSRMALLLFDLDNFKDINDSLGHPAGDELLVAVAGRLSEGLGAKARLARVGGDEFMLLIEDLGAMDQVERIADTLLADFGEPFALRGGHRIFIGASVGLSLFPDHAVDATTLVQYADAAMNQAKKEGRNRWRLFDEALVENASQRLRLDARLRDALRDGAFDVHFQPVLARADRDRIVGFEALLRWAPEDIGPISPEEFIPVAESTGLIIPLGEWVLEQACRFAASLDEQGAGSVWVAVNLSALQLKSPDLPERITEALARHQLAAERLVIEITESSLMEQGERAVSLLARLRALGIGVSLDDFGTGYSSLAYLKHFEVDSIKIDRSFVAELDSCESDRDLVTAIIGLARSFGLDVIAEGVESRVQLDILTELGCSQYQGYLLSPAVPADQARQLLDRHLAETTP